MPGGFAEKIIVKDEWELNGERFRLVDLGAGPRELQKINPLTEDMDWSPEKECYVHALLCARIESLSNAEIKVEKGENNG